MYNWPSNKSDLQPHHDRLANSWPSHTIHKSIGINSGPRTRTTARSPWYTWNQPHLTCDTLRLISDRPTTWPRVTCVTRQKFTWDKNLKSDLQQIYDCDEWHTRQPSELRPTCKDLQSKEDPAVSWVTCKWNLQVTWPFLTVKSGRGACRFRWRAGPSYCEYPRVTYDLLVSNIGGTYDLADQLPTNGEFGHFLVVSQSLGSSV